MNGQPERVESVALEIHTHAVLARHSSFNAEKLAQGQQGLQESWQPASAEKSFEKASFPSQDMSTPSFLRNSDSQCVRGMSVVTPYSPLKPQYIKHCEIAYCEGV